MYIGRVSSLLSPSLRLEVEKKRVMQLRQALRNYTVQVKYSMQTPLWKSVWFKHINFLWFDTSNWGDALNPVLIECISGIKARGFDINLRNQLPPPQESTKQNMYLVIGSTINSFIYSYLWSNCNKQQDAGSLIKHNNEQNPLWLRQLIQQAIQEKGWWLIPQLFWFRRFHNLQNHSRPQALLRLPFAVSAFLVDTLIFFQANREIHSRGGLGYWGK